MRLATSAILVTALALPVHAQPARRFPPDSLVNTKVIPHGTPVMQVVGTMRNFAGALGVRCQFCHVGEEGKPLDQFDFASDDKRTKLVARQMMLMVQEVNRRLDTLPMRAANGLQVTCATCHRGVSRPVPLATLVADAAMAGGADSATRAYRALRAQYYGSDAYDFREQSLNNAALRLARASRPDDAAQLLTLNEEFYPNASGTSVVRANIALMRGDTATAETALREALKRDPKNGEARNRLRDIGKTP